MPIAIDAAGHEDLKQQLAQCEADGQQMTAEIARLTAERDHWQQSYVRCNERVCELLEEKLNGASQQTAALREAAQGRLGSG